MYMYIKLIHGSEDLIYTQGYKRIYPFSPYHSPFIFVIVMPPTPISTLED